MLSILAEIDSRNKPEAAGCLWITLTNSLMLGSLMLATISFIWDERYQAKSSPSLVLFTSLLERTDIADMRRISWLMFPAGLDCSCDLDIWVLSVETN